jgi:glycosyltransferase involved in cell wall biosynthesis
MRTILDIRTTTGHFPGVGRYAYQLAHALSRQANRDELVLLTTPESTRMRFDISALAAQPGVRIVQTHASPFSLREQIELPGALRRLAPALMHFPYVIIPFAAPKPYVLAVHDIIPIQLPRFFTLRQRILYRVSLSLAVRRAHGVICISESTRADVQSRLRVDPSRLFVALAGVSSEFYPRGSEEIQQVRKAYHLPDDYILYVGSNKPHKNLPTLVEAAALLRSKNLLVVAGASDSRFSQEFMNVERLGLASRVRFLGSVQEEVLPTLYSGARAFVFPSLYEGFGLPVMEAMACGIPVACSDIPSLRETAAGAALFFNPKDPQAIATALDQVIQDDHLRADLRHKGTKRAAELTWDATAQQVLKVYQAVTRG